MSLVCEGAAELQFAKVIREAYLPRNCGTVLRPQNAFGGGGKKSLFVARQLQAHEEYDSYAILIDNDDHWTDAERSAARDAGIVVIENTPCLEATLLRIAGKNFSSRTSENKDMFLSEYGGEAHVHGLIQQHFPKAALDLARARVAELDAFLRLIGR